MDALNKRKPIKNTIALLLLAPLTGLAGAAVWVMGGNDAIWPNIEWCSFILFIPVAHWLTKTLKPVTPVLAGWAAVLNLIGCVACAGHMNLFRYNAVLSYHGKRNFADVLMNEMDKNLMGVFTYLPALLFPVSYVVFGIAVIKSKLFDVLSGILMITFGILFWQGNAGESDIALIAAYAAALVSFILIVIKISKNNPSLSVSK